MSLTLKTIAGAVAAGVVAVLVVCSPAAASTTTDWADWEPLAGTANDYSGSVTIASNPLLVADYVSDSRSGSVGVISGSSSWLSELTPVGEKYGSSRDNPYLNLRPVADSLTSPSTTTYTFRTPMPPSGWTFVLGDIDADMVHISALGPDGVALTSSELGYRDSFNYCVSASCTPTQVPADVPLWDASTTTLSSDPINNAGSNDTRGAAAWFEPQKPITSLTFVYTRITGFPVFQTWFASLARDITGTVTNTASAPVGGATVTLKDRTGAVVATTVTGAAGEYAFVEFLATEGYFVTLTAPDGTAVVDNPTQAVNLTSEDAIVNFTVRPDISTPLEGESAAELPATGIQASFAARLSFPLGLITLGALALLSTSRWRPVRSPKDASKA